MTLLLVQCALALLILMGVDIVAALLGGPRLEKLPSNLFEYKRDGRASGLKPNFRGRLYTPEYNAEVRTNDGSLRDDRSITEILRAPGRIMVLGDSFAFGQGVSFLEMTSTVLEGLIRAAGSHEAVFSAAYEDGWSPVQYELYPQRFYDRFQPQVVVLLLFPFNDMEESEMILTRRDAPGGILSQQLRHEALVGGDLVNAPDGKVSLSLKVKVWLEKNSFVFRNLRRILGNATRNLRRSLGLIRSPPPPYPLPRYFLQSGPQNGDHPFEESVQSLLNMDAFLKARGRKLVVFFIPSSFQIQEHYLDAWGGPGRLRPFGNDDQLPDPRAGNLPAQIVNQQTSGVGGPH